MFEYNAGSLFADLSLPNSSLKKRDRIRLHQLLHELNQQKFEHTSELIDFLEEVIQLNDVILRMKKESGYSLFNPDWFNAAQKIVKTNIELALRISKDRELMTSIGLAAEGVTAARELLINPHNQIAANKLLSKATTLNQAIEQRENDYKHPLGINDKTRKKLRTSSLLFAVLSALTAFAMISCLFVCSSLAVTLAVPLILGVGILLAIAGILKLLAAERYLKIAALYQRSSEFNESIGLSRSVAKAFTHAKEVLSQRSLVKQGLFRVVVQVVQEDRHATQAENDVNDMRIAML